MPGFNWTNDPNPGAVNLFAMEDRLDTDINMLFQSNQVRLIPHFRTSQDRSYLKESRDIHLAFAPYMFAAKMNGLPELILDLQQARLQDIHAILDYREPDQIREGYQISIMEISSSRGVMIKDAFAQIAINVNRTLVMALTLDVTSYIRVERRSDTHWVVLCNKLSHGLMLRIASIIPILFPAYRNANYIPEQLPILLAQDSYDRYVQAYSNWILPLYADLIRDLRWTELREGLRSIRSSQLNEINNTIASLTRETDQHMDSLRYLHEELNRQMLMRFGFENSNDEQYNALYNYIKRNRFIHNIRTGDSPGVIIFTVSVPLTNWNTDQAEQLLNSGITNHLNSPPDQKAACYDLLVKQEAQLWFNVTFGISFINGALSRYDFDAIVPGIPNKHIYTHNCWGNNGPAVQNAIRNKQFEAAFEQALSACGSLNMSDGTVTGGMFRALHNQDSLYSRRCIMLDPASTQEMLTWAEYVEHVRVKNLPPIILEPEVPTDETDADNGY